MNKDQIMAKINNWNHGKFGLKLINIESEVESSGEEKVSFQIRLHYGTYFISAHKDYLGCTAVCNHKLPGETRHRGNDLADGRLNKTNWNNILADIVSFEARLSLEAA